VAFRFMRGATAEDLARVRKEFADGARVVADAGFDAIEVHLGHGYLLSAFLSPRLNRRSDVYGGSVQNRARFPREVVGAVREAVGDRVALLGKLNMDDGVRGGLRPDESVEAARLLESDGTLDALELTAGSSFQNPMYLFRGEAPVRELAAAMPRLLGVGTRIAGRRFLREYPFEEAFLLPAARRIREAVSMPLILLGGINRLDTIRTAMREGFEFVAMARALLMEPDLVHRMQSGAATEGVCIHCNKCMATIYSGTRCVLVD
jgi:2,4-dienoyl-CoA reductase-like NADH-dependent reductase (Old Yellow Enzyme family)